MITDYAIQNGSIVARDSNGVTVFVVPQLDNVSPVDQLAEYCELMEHELSQEMQ